MNSNVRVAYLVNQYPSTSHSFIRREIQALESLGATVFRYSIRKSKDGYVDGADAKEAEKTRVLLDDKFRLIGAALKRAISGPARMAAAVKTTAWHANRSDRGWARNVAYLLEACRLCELLEAEGVRHVHAHFGTNSAIVAELCRILSGCDFSFTVHGPEEFDRAVVLGLGRMVENAKFVAAISQYGRSQLLRLVGRGHWDSVAVVRCGLERALLDRPLTPIPTAPRLVCVGRLHEQKGQHVLLEAAKRLADNGIDFELVLAGDGPLRDILEKHIAALGLAQRVRITGWITESQVKEELDSARAMVLPSFAEGLPVVIMEALALGRPVISTYVAGIPELVRPGENGWLVPPSDVERLALAMQEVLEAEPARLEAMGRAGRAAVTEMHDVSLSAKTLLSLFQSGQRKTADSVPND